MIEKTKPIPGLSTRRPSIACDCPANRGRDYAYRAINSTIWIATVCIIGALLYAAPPANASVHAPTAKAVAETGDSSLTRVLLTGPRGWSRARAMLATRFSGIVCSGDPGYGNDSDSGAGSASNDNQDEAQSSSQSSARDATREPKKNGASGSADSGASASSVPDSRSADSRSSNSRSPDSGTAYTPPSDPRALDSRASDSRASDTGSPDSRTANTPLPGPGASDSRSPDSSSPGKGDASAKQGRGSSEAERLPREPTTLAQLPSTADKSSSPSSLGSSQRGPDGQEGSTAGADPAKSFSEFVEDYWPWLIAALALVLFGLSRLMAKGGTET